MTPKITPSEILDQADRQLIEEIILDQMTAIRFGRCEQCSRIIRQLLDFNEGRELVTASIDTLGYFFEHYDRFKTYDGIYDAEAGVIYCPSCLLIKRGTELLRRVQALLEVQCANCQYHFCVEYKFKKLPRPTLTQCEFFNQSCARSMEKLLRQNQSLCLKYKPMKAPN